MWQFIKRWYHRLGSPKHFYRISGLWLPWLGAVTLALFIWGSYLGLVVAPADYQQGESYRIIFVHVPAASMSLFAYMVMAIAGAVGLIWRMKMGEVIASAAAPIGAAFTFLALATGSLWGKPMWGTWWQWDARLTSELILLFLYLGFMALEAAIEDERTAARACAILALVGVVNIPIIHYSVTWWNTLHQPPSGNMFVKEAIDPSMRPALYVMMLAFMVYFVTLLLLRARAKILRRERKTAWVQELIPAPQT
jgi:heme exporter protein C